ETMRGGAPQAQGKSLLRTDPLSHKRPVAQIQFSGGVSEFIYGNEAKKFGDLGPLLAAEIRARVDSFCTNLEPSIEGIRATVVGGGMSIVWANGHPLVLAGDGDVGGLLGIHLHEEMKLKNPVVSIDGLELKEFDYIDIGTMLESSGAVPVVIKSLIFPGNATAGEVARAAATA